MALLDIFDSEQGRLGLGLLAMAQPSRMSDGERMLGALQMLDQFKAQRSAAEERKADREERARVRMLQEQQIQMQIEAAKRQQAREGAADAYRASLIPGGDGIGPTRPFDPLTAATILPPDQVSQLMQIQEAQRKAQQQEQIQNAIRRAVSPVQPIEANAASGIPGPRPEALAAVGQRRPIDFQQLIAMGVPESMVKALAEAPNYGRPEVARTIEVDDGKGGKATRRESRFGEVIGEDLPAYVAPVQVNRGNQITFTRPAPGLSLSVAMSPGEAAADARARERLAFDRQNQQGAVTYQQDNDGNFVALPTRLAPGEVVRATPVMAPGGVAPLKGAPKASQMTEDQAKATGWLVQASNAYKNMLAAIDPKKGTPSAAYPGFPDMLAAIPSFGATAGIANFMRGADRQKFMQASSSLSEALLRAATGAGVNQSEAEQKIKELTPVFGESEETTKQKLGSIPVYIEALRVRAGGGASRVPGLVSTAGSDPLGLR